MRILLDTHVWLWMQVSPEKIPKSARALLEDPENTLHFSAASAWEIAIKYQIGKLALPAPPRAYIPERLLRDGIANLPVQLHHTFYLCDLPEHHRDPFDRLLIAQAILEKLTLFTADHELRPYEVEMVFLR